MPSIADRTVPLDTTKYERVDPPSTSSTLPSLGVSPYTEPGMNPNLRSILPPFFAAADNLRQFYTGGSTPQYRVLPTTPLKSS